MASVSLNTNVSAVSTGSYRYDNFGRRKDMQDSNTSSLSGSSSSSNSRLLSNMSGLQSAGTQLQDAVKLLTGNSSVFKNKVAASSNTDVLTIDKSSVTSSYASDMEVSVKQVATAQENKGAALKSDDTSAAKAGTNKIAIEINGKTNYLDINVTAGDTNSQVQQKLADKINSGKLGITASVEYDDKNGTSSLVLKANDTGTGANGGDKFAIRDVDTGKGTANGIVNETGASNVTQKAQNAQYTVNNGYTRTSASNTVDLGSGITATLKKASADPVKVSLNNNTDSITSAVNDLVKGFNALLSQAKSSDSSKLTSQLNSVSKAFSSTLSRIGISTSKDGSLTIDSDKLKKAAEDGSLERAIGSNSGFTNRLDQISSKVEKNPGNYVDTKKSASSSSISNSESYLDNLTFNTLYSNRFGSNYSSVSMLFDMFA